MLKKLKIVLIISLALNLMLIFSGMYVINKKGGVSWIVEKSKAVFNSNKVTSINQSAYYLLKTSIYDIQNNNENAIVFLGDSITDNFDWYEAFKNIDIQNRGISNDTTDGILERLDVVIKENPKKIFLMIGINDLGNGKKVDYIVNNYKNILSKIKNESPNTIIYVQSVLPINKSLNGNGIFDNSDIMELNAQLEKLSDKNVIFVDLFSLLKTDKNELNKDFTYDGTHINGEGYKIWTNIIKNFVN